MEWLDIQKANEKVLGIPLTSLDNYVFSTSEGKMRTEGGVYTALRRF